MNNSKKLEVGDVVFGHSNYGLTRWVIERVTTTQAVSGRLKFKRDVPERGVLDEVGRGKWSTTIYRISSPILEEQFGRSELINELKDCDWSNITTEGLEQIKSIIQTLALPKK